MLSPSNLYPTDCGYFFYTNDGRYFSIYFTPYFLEWEDEDGHVQSEEYTMIGIEPVPNVPEEYAAEELGFTDERSSTQIDTALSEAINNFFDANSNEILIYFLSTKKNQHRVRRRRFEKVVAQLGEEITCVNYELDEFPDTGFLILTDHRDKDDITAFFNEYIEQLLN